MRLHSAFPSPGPGSLDDTTASGRTSLGHAADSSLPFSSDDVLAEASQAWSEKDNGHRHGDIVISGSSGSSGKSNSSLIEKSSAVNHDRKQSFRKLLFDKRPGFTRYRQWNIGGRGEGEEQGEGKEQQQQQEEDQEEDQEGQEGDNNTAMGFKKRKRETSTLTPLERQVSSLDK